MSENMSVGPQRIGTHGVSSGPAGGMQSCLSDNDLQHQGKPSDASAAAPTALGQTTFARLP